MKKRTNGVVNGTLMNKSKDEVNLKTPFVMIVSSRFLVVTCVACTLFAFAMGLIAHRLLAWGAKDGKVPETIRYDRDFLNDIKTPPNVKTSGRTYPLQTCSANHTGELEQHAAARIPTAGHFIVDLMGVDRTFLNSMGPLMDAIENVSRETALTLRNTKCHELQPSGVSCVGHMMEGYLAFHTWPEDHVITLDLFAAGSRKLTFALPIIKNHFGIPHPRHEIISIWAHKSRGYKDVVETTDLDRYILGHMGWDVKEEIVSLDTEFQRIDIYDVLRIDPDDNVENQQPNRILHLDGVLQSSSRGEGRYHEAFVHPAMFAHEDPKHVVIVGGGEGSTLREVLKHNTVERATVIEIDEGVVNVAREYLSQWNDCTDLVGVANVCFDDARVEMHYEDAVSWFLDKYSSNQQPDSKMVGDDDLLDFVIIDLVDPRLDGHFSCGLYSNWGFIESVFNSLSDDGVMVMQVGEAPRVDDPPDISSPFRNRHVMTQMLQDVGFKGTVVYEEAHGGFRGPRSFLVAFKDDVTRSNWYHNEPTFESMILSRTVPTESGQSPYRYFDGATMLSYQQPPKSFETVFCRQETVPHECKSFRGFNTNYSNAPVSSFEVKNSRADNGAGRGVYTKVDIEKGTHLAMEKSVDFLHFEPETYDLMKSFSKEVEQSSALDAVATYASAYGFERNTRGRVECSVDSSILKFVNHGCNGTHNGDWDRDFGAPLYDNSYTEVTADPAHMRSLVRSQVFNPVADRHSTKYNVGKALRPIRAGEEILANYLGYVQTQDEWEKEVEHLRAMCRGEAVGEVTKYEDKKSYDDENASN